MGRWEPNHAGIGEMLSAEWMVREMRRRAENVATRATQTSPVGPVVGGRTDHYRDAWRVESGVRNLPTRRAYARVVNPRPYAAAVEFGNGRTGGKTIDAHYVLTNALDAAKE
ncbi:MAG: hypothetical protein JWO67_4178 [Streptosporangiaceae bacterium]|nr:hypothetical protein [Streptosporangiaceae bacterium]